MTDTQTRNRVAAPRSGGDFAGAWRPADESNDTLAGVVEARSMRPVGGKVKAPYPILTVVVKPVNKYGEVVAETNPEAIVSTQDGEVIPFGERRAVHAGRKALKDFLDTQDPQEGDVVLLEKYPKVQTKAGQDFVPYDTAAWSPDGEPRFEVEDEDPSDFAD